MPIRLSREDKIVARVRDMLACHGMADAARANAEKLTSDLDRFFYAIFGLTLEEIQMKGELFGTGRQPKPAT